MNFHSVSRRFLIALTVLAVGCAGKEKPKEETAAPVPPPQPREVGMVSTVNTELGFVLIDTRNYAILPAGLALKSFPPGVSPGEGGETAVLAVGAERRGSFVVADVVTGSPGRGDRVYQ